MPNLLDLRALNKSLFGEPVSVGWLFMEWDDALLIISKSGHNENVIMEIIEQLLVCLPLLMCYLPQKAINGDGNSCSTFSHKCVLNLQY